MQTIVEYVWLGGNSELRSKARVMNQPVNTINDLAIWNYDGSSTGQATGDDSEVVLLPVALFRDPFRKNNHRLVLCETYRPDGTPTENNHREWATRVFHSAIDAEPWFGLEQEYFMITPTTGVPLGFEHAESQGQYYCSVGHQNAFGRNIAEEHLAACLYAGIKISGINAEVAPGQWEFQVGPCVGIEEGDHLWMARYLLERVGEKNGVVINIEPKPIMGDWNGSGCHANFSTKYMREGHGDKTGLDYIYQAIERLSRKHTEHMDVYGLRNIERLSGAHETSPYHQFSYGVANRGASVRIGNDVYRAKQGYFEDRRPGANCDPYLVSGMIFQTTVVDELEGTQSVPLYTSEDLKPHPYWGA
jgi:glutamine synthetase